ncbi:MAG: type II toxin-antitoxin system VapC family toxin [Chloroflexota bacterium]|nr:type II toxin-antitoxin system VapC family toxin [Chloroflexota bacterium]
MDQAVPRGSLTLVVDASFTVRACLSEKAFRALGRQRLFAPPHMWAEVRSALHEAAYRGELGRDAARRALDQLADAPVAVSSPQGLGREAWRIADEFGWAKTHDAEYVALAKLLGCRLVTIDLALRRGTSRLGFVVGPDEI